MANLNLNSTSNSRKNFPKLIKSLKKNADLFSLCLCGLGGIYLATVEPFIFTLFLISSLSFFCVNQLFRFNPAFGNQLGLKKIWQIGSLITAFSILFSLLQLPAHAVFLENLEQFVVTLAAGAGTGVTADSIQLIFNLIRAIFLVLVAVAALFAYNQAQQGNDWRPIMAQAAMAFGVILSIDVVTFLFIG